MHCSQYINNIFYNFNISIVDDNSSSYSNLSGIIFTVHNSRCNLILHHELGWFLSNLTLFGCTTSSIMLRKQRAN